jgi:hypothetical protein
LANLVVESKMHWHPRFEQFRHGCDPEQRIFCLWHSVHACLERPLLAPYGMEIWYPSAWSVFEREHWYCGVLMRLAILLFVPGLDEGELGISGADGSGWAKAPSFNNAVQDTLSKAPSTTK